MGVFKDSAEVYHFIGGIFEAGFRDPELAPKFKAVGTIFRFDYADPASVLTVDFTEGVVEYGTSTRQPDVELIMNADVAHRFWLGKVNVAMGIAKGQIKIKGAVPKVMKVVPITKPLFETYRQMLEEAGRTDLLSV